MLFQISCKLRRTKDKLEFTSDLDLQLLHLLEEKSLKYDCDKDKKAKQF